MVLARHDITKSYKVMTKSYSVTACCQHSIKIAWVIDLRSGSLRSNMGEHRSLVVGCSIKFIRCASMQLIDSQVVARFN